jgi:coenzyme F420-reducing hydrogenase beta subunit
MELWARNADLTRRGRARTYDEPYRFVIHDRDAIYSSAVDRALASMQLQALITPVRAPTAKAYASYCTPFV